MRKTMKEYGLLGPYFVKTARAQAAFERSYGRAMVAWAHIEDNLCQIFVSLTGLSEEVGRAIFFSARNFSARSDMLDAVIEAAHLDNDTSEFLKDVLTRATAYSGFRNALAHRIPRVNTSNFNRHVFEMHEGGKILPLSEAITKKEVEIAADNFTELHRILFLSWVDHWHPMSRSSDPTPLAEYREQVFLLPSEASSKTLSQKQRGRQRQREAAQRKTRRGR